MIISIWGANGSGKTSLTSLLGSEIAKSKFTLLIGGALTHSSIQHFFGLAESNKSLKHALTNSDTIRSNVTNHPKIKDLFILDLGAQENCLEQADTTDEQAESLLQVANNIFEVVIIDCSTNYNNPLTRAALINSNIIINLLQPTLEGVSFTVSHRVLLERLNLLSKTIYIVNKDQKKIELNKIKKLIEAKIFIGLPMCSGVNSCAVSGTPLTILGASNRAENRFLKKLRIITNHILSKQ